MIIRLAVTAAKENNELIRSELLSNPLCLCRERGVAIRCPSSDGGIREEPGEVAEWPIAPVC